MKVKLRLLLFIFALPLVLSAQSHKPIVKSDTIKIYTQAIRDFIAAVDTNKHVAFDTLFFGTAQKGAPGALPQLLLPARIENVQIRVVRPENAALNQKIRSTRIFINLVGWVNPKRAEFIFVVFSDGFEHKYDCYINYDFNSKQQQFEIDKLMFKNPPFDK